MRREDTDTVGDMEEDSTGTEDITAGIAPTEAMPFMDGMAQDSLEGRISIPGITTEPRTMTRTHYHPRMPILSRQPKRPTSKVPQ